MKFLINILLVVLTIGVAGLFILKKPDGTPWISLDIDQPDFALPDLRESLEGVKSLFTGADNSADTQATGTRQETSGVQRPIYRWQDDQGTWNYSDSPPPGVQAEVMELQAPTVLTLYPVVQEQISDAGTQASTAPPVQSDLPTTEDDTSLFPGDVRQVQETLQQAEDVSNQFRERLEEQQRVLEEL